MNSCRIEIRCCLQELKVREKAVKGVKGSVGSPMPGELLKLPAKPGDTVKVGETLAVISAMKMEMVVKAPIGGVIKAVSAAIGDKLEGDDLILEIE